MLKSTFAAAGVLALAAFSSSPANAMPMGGAVLDMPATVENVHGWHDGGHRRGPPPWAPAWGRRYHERQAYGYRYRGWDGPRRYRSYDDGPYYRRPGVTFRFGY